MLSRTLALVFAVVMSAPAQNPKLGSVEIFGLRKVPAEKVRKALGVLELGQLPPSKGEAEERIEAIDGILRASLEAVCCEQGRAILYVGVQERGVPTIEFRDNPIVELDLPEEITKEWLEFITAVEVAARAGNTAEDLSRGYSLMADEGARRWSRAYRCRRS